MNETNINEQILEAMRIIATSEIKKVHFDQTIKGTIIGDEAADEGRYWCSNGYSEFWAYSTEIRYRKNDKVLITVPGGDYNNQKVIISKQADEQNSPLVIQSPLATMVDLSNNLVTGSIEEAIWVNEGMPNSGNNTTDLVYSWDINTKFFNSSNAFKYGVPFYDSGEGKIFDKNISRLGLSAQFSTWLSEYSTIAGNYGIALELTFRDGNTALEKTYRRINWQPNQGNTYYKKNGDNYIELTENEKTYLINGCINIDNNIIKYDNDNKLIFRLSPGAEPQEIYEYTVLNEFQKYIHFDSDEFFGDVYGYDTYYTNETVFDLTEVSQFAIVRVRAWLYQRDNFQTVYGEYVPTRKINNNSDFFETTVPNLFMKDPYICLGTAAEEFLTDMASLVSDSSEYYSKSGYENDSKRIEGNLKKIRLKWVHKDENTGIIRLVEEDEYPEDYEIRWYRWALGASSPDPFAGAHWERYYGCKTTPDGEGNFAINEEEQKSLRARNSELEGNSEVIDWLNDIDPTNKINTTFYPNYNRSQEKLKVIILKAENTKLTTYVPEANGELKETAIDGDIVYRFAAESNEILFTNKDEIRNEQNYLDMNALSIRFDDHSNGRYFLYNRAGNVSKESDLEIRYLTAVFDENVSNVYDKMEIPDNAFVTWTFPDGGTMITPATSADLNAKPTSQLIFQNTKSVGYFIKKSLSRQDNNNTVQLTAIIDGVSYTAEAHMVFGTAGTSGSDYTLDLVWNDTALDVTDPSSGLLIGEVGLFDQAGNQLLGDSNTISEITSDYELKYEWAFSEIIPEGYVAQEYDYNYEENNILYPIFFQNDSRIAFGEDISNEDNEDIRSMYVDGWNDFSSYGGYYYFQDTSTMLVNWLNQLLGENVVNWNNNKFNLLKTPTNDSIKNSLITLAFFDINQEKFIYLRDYFNNSDNQTQENFNYAVNTQLYRKRNMVDYEIHVDLAIKNEEFYKAAYDFLFFNSSINIYQEVINRLMANDLSLNLQGNPGRLKSVQEIGSNKQNVWIEEQFEIKTELDDNLSSQKLELKKINIIEFITNCLNFSIDQTLLSEKQKSLVAENEDYKTTIKNIINDFINTSRVFYKKEGNGFVVIETQALNIYQILFESIFEINNFYYLILSNFNDFGLQQINKIDSIEDANKWNYAYKSKINDKEIFKYIFQEWNSKTGNNILNYLNTIILNENQEIYRCFTQTRENSKIVKSLINYNENDFSFSYEQPKPKISFKSITKINDITNDPEITDVANQPYAQIIKDGGFENDTWYIPESGISFSSNVKQNLYKALSKIFFNNENTTLFFSNMADLNEIITSMSSSSNHGTDELHFSLDGVGNNIEFNSYIKGNSFSYDNAIKNLNKLWDSENKDFKSNISWTLDGESLSPNTNDEHKLKLYLNIKTILFTNSGDADDLLTIFLNAKSPLILKDNLEDNNDFDFQNYYLINQISNTNNYKILNTLIDYLRVTSSKNLQESRYKNIKNLFENHNQASLVHTNQSAVFNLWQNLAYYSGLNENFLTSENAKTAIFNALGISSAWSLQDINLRNQFNTDFYLTESNSNIFYKLNEFLSKSNNPSELINGLITNSRKYAQVDNEHPVIEDLQENFYNILRQCISGDSDNIQFIELPDSSKDSRLLSLFGATQSAAINSNIEYINNMSIVYSALNNNKNIDGDSLGNYYQKFVYQKSNNILNKENVILDTYGNLFQDLKLASNVNDYEVYFSKINNVYKYFSSTSNIYELVLANDNNSNLLYSLKYSILYYLITQAAPSLETLMLNMSKISDAWDDIITMRSIPASEPMTIKVGRNDDVQEYEVLIFLGTEEELNQQLNTTSSESLLETYPDKFKVLKNWWNNSPSFSKFKQLRQQNNVYIGYEKYVTTSDAITGTTSGYKFIRLNYNYDDNFLDTIFFKSLTNKDFKINESNRSALEECCKYLLFTFSLHRDEEGYETIADGDIKLRSGSWFSTNPTVTISNETMPSATTTPLFTPSEFNDLKSLFAMDEVLFIKKTNNIYEDVFTVLSGCTPKNLYSKKVINMLCSYIVNDSYSTGNLFNNNFRLYQGFERSKFDIIDYYSKNDQNYKKSLVWVIYDLLTKDRLQLESKPLESINYEAVLKDAFSNQDLFFGNYFPFKQNNNNITTNNIITNNDTYEIDANVLNITPYLSQNNLFYLEKTLEGYEDYRILLVDKLNQAKQTKISKENAKDASVALLAIKELIFKIAKEKYENLIENLSLLKKVKALSVNNDMLQDNDITDIFYYQTYCILMGVDINALGAKHYNLNTTNNQYDYTLSNGAYGRKLNYKAILAQYKNCNQNCTIYFDRNNKTNIAALNLYYEENKKDKSFYDKILKFDENNIVTNNSIIDAITILFRNNIVIKQDVNGTKTELQLEDACKIFAETVFLNINNINSKNLLDILSFIPNNNDNASLKLLKLPNNFEECSSFEELEQSNSNFQQEYSYLTREIFELIKELSSYYYIKKVDSSSKFLYNIKDEWDKCFNNLILSDEVSLRDLIFDLSDDNFYKLDFYLENLTEFKDWAKSLWDLTKVGEISSKTEVVNKVNQIINNYYKLNWQSINTASSYNIIKNYHYKNLSNEIITIDKIFFNENINEDISLVQLINGFNRIKQNENLIYEKTNYENQDQENISYSALIDNRIFNYHPTTKKAFIKVDDNFIVDPYTEYREEETYYYPVQAQKSVNKTVPLIYSPKGEKGREVWVYPRAKLNSKELMNSLSVLKVTLTHFGDYDLEAYFPIALKRGTIRDSINSTILWTPAYIEGASYVRYSSMGETDFEKNPYKIYKRYLQVMNGTQSFTRDRLVPALTYGQNETIEGWNIIYPPLDPNNISNFIPALSETVKDIEPEIIENFGYKYKLPLLHPITVYIPDAPIYGVQFYWNKETITDSNAQLHSIFNNDEVNGAIWTQPIFCYEDNYPSTTINKWDGKTIQTDEDTGIILSSAIATGKKERDNTFTGVMMGDWSRDDADTALTKHTGLFGFNHGSMSYAFKDDGTGFIGKDGRGRIIFDGNKSTIFSNNWKGTNQCGMFLDIDDGVIKLQSEEKDIPTVSHYRSKVIEYKNLDGETIDISDFDDIEDDEEPIYGNNETEHILAQRYITLSSSAATYPFAIGLDKFPGNRNFKIDWNGDVEAKNVIIENLSAKGTIDATDSIFRRGKFQSLIDCSSGHIYGASIQCRYLEAKVKGLIAGWSITANALVNSDGTTVLYGSVPNVELENKHGEEVSIENPFNASMVTNRIRVLAQGVTKEIDDHGNITRVIANDHQQYLDIGFVDGYAAGAETSSSSMGMEGPSRIILKSLASPSEEDHGVTLGLKAMHGGINLAAQGDKTHITLGAPPPPGISGQGVTFDGDYLYTTIPAEQQYGFYAKFA